MWGRLIEGHRCVVIVDGFYEWKAPGKDGKVPIFIRHVDGYQECAIGCGEEKLKMVPGCSAPLLLAGLYDSWDGLPSGRKEEPADAVDIEALLSMTVLTMDPMHTPMEVVHDRMPVFLTPQTAAIWLDPAARYADVVGRVLSEAKEHARAHLKLYEVSSLVSNVRSESPDCILSKKEYDEKQLAKGIGRFFKKVEAKTECKTASTGTSPAPERASLVDPLTEPGAKSERGLRVDGKDEFEGDPSAKRPRLAAEALCAADLQSNVIIEIDD